MQPAVCTAASKWQKTLKQRYKILEQHVIGQGSTGTVYKGLDKQECRNVAVKLYIEDGLEAFRHSINVFQALGGKMPNTDDTFQMQSCGHERASFGVCLEDVKSSTMLGIIGQKDSFLDHLDVQACFVKLLDFSKTDTGEAGMDAEDEELFLVFELAEESLEDKLSSLQLAEEQLTVEELRDLQWTLVSIVWGLHSAGYVHLDIKPQNVMRFRVGGRDQWKLIDLDGAVPTRSEQNLEDITFTSEYMPPELARAFCSVSSFATSTSAKRGPCPNTLTISRLMDVWSIGMCALECLFLQPVLFPYIEEWSRETGSDMKFYEWLSDYQSDPIVSADMKDYIASIDEDMASLLEGMLTKDPSSRSSISQCMVHPWFKPMRDALIAEFTGEGPDEVRPADRKTGVSRTCAVM